MKQHLKVAYATDQRYVSYTGISIYSLLDNNKIFEKITMYILDTGVDKEGKKQLCDIVGEFGREIIFLDCTNLSNWLGKEILDMFSQEDTNVPIASYARLFLPELLKDVDKVFYLDADSIVLGRYDTLWKQDISDYAALGVLDNVGKIAREKVGLPEDFPYVNAGMLLLNLKRLREINFTEQVKQFIGKYHGRVYHHDQGIINGVLRDQLGRLPLKYNLMSFVFEHKNVEDIVFLQDLPIYYDAEEFAMAKVDPVFIHFTEGYLQRPWIDNCKHPMREKWKEYRNKTIWRKMPLGKDKRSLKLRVLAWINLKVPIKLTKCILNIREK